MDRESACCYISFLWLLSALMSPTHTHAQTDCNSSRVGRRNPNVLISSISRDKESFERLWHADVSYQWADKATTQVHLQPLRLSSSLRSAHLLWEELSLLPCETGRNWSISNSCEANMLSETRAFILNQSKSSLDVPYFSTLSPYSCFNCGSHLLRLHQ